MGEWGPWIAAGLTGFLMIFGLVRTMNGLGDEWSLTRALSDSVEEVDPASGKKTVYVASTSRLIAFLGAVVTTSVLAVLSMLAVYYVALGKGEADFKGIKEALNVVLYGATSFIPYGLNKIGSALAPK
jgi:hypothetical protein